MLASLPRVENENVLIGFDTADDAGVYKLTPELALVQTVDFFTPIVDDPYTYGAIAAANSLSDVYAMGGQPISALSVLAYPAKGDLDDLEQILRGGADKIREAGCALIGGETAEMPGLYARGDYDLAVQAYSEAAGLEPTPDIDRKIEETRGRAALAKLPAEYRAKFTWRQLASSVPPKASKTWSRCRSR